MARSPKLPRWNDILLEIYKSREGARYGEKLNRGVKGSRTHLREIIHMIEQSGLIEVIPGKKIKRLLLTDRGQKIAELLLQLKLALPDR